MRKILRNRLALSTVVTTLIILVVSVLLAGVVTYFAINVVSTRVQQESLTLSFPHIWVDSAGKTQAAILITNTGGRDVIINAVQIRGISGTYGTNVYTDFITGSAPSDLLPQTGWTGAGFAATTAEPITLASGKMVAVYIDNPSGVTINDIGTTIGMTVFTAQALYYQETNVQATITTLPTT
jgi:hypothetical protein